MIHQLRSGGEAVLYIVLHGAHILLTDKTRKGRLKKHSLGKMGGGHACRQTIHERFVPFLPTVRKPLTNANWANKWCPVKQTLGGGRSPKQQTWAEERHVATLRKLAPPQRSEASAFCLS